MRPRTNRFLSFGPSVVMALSLLAGCAGNRHGAEPPVPAYGAPDIAPGARVQVERQGQWYPATVVQPTGDGRFLIHYDNTGDEWNEPVGPERIQVPGTPNLARDYRPGEKILVEGQGRVALADVVQQVGPDAWRVHYDGFGAETGENVGPDRMRRAFAGASPHVLGEGLLVDVNGTVLPAKVIAVVDQDHWLVRFDNFGPQYDLSLIHI